MVDCQQLVLLEGSGGEREAAAAAGEGGGGVGVLRRGFNLLNLN